MFRYIGKICSKAFRGLYNMRQIRKFLTVQSTKTLIHAFVSSRLDCSALLFGLPKYQHDRSPKFRNAAVRVTFQIAKFGHITPALIDLHWLPVTFRAQFKLLLFVDKSLYNQSPSYITDLLSVKPAANCALRSPAKISSVHFKSQLLHTWRLGLSSCSTCFMELTAINYKNK